MKFKIIVIMFILIVFYGCNTNDAINDDYVSVTTGAGGYSNSSSSVGYDVIITLKHYLNGELINPDEFFARSPDKISPYSNMGTEILFSGDKQATTFKQFKYKWKYKKQMDINFIQQRVIDSYNTKEVSSDFGLRGYFGYVYNYAVVIFNNDVYETTDMKSRTFNITENVNIEIIVYTSSPWTNYEKWFELSTPRTMVHSTDNTMVEAASEITYHKGVTFSGDNVFMNSEFKPIILNVARMEKWEIYNIWLGWSGIINTKDKTISISGYHPTPEYIKFEFGSK